MSLYGFLDIGARNYPWGSVIEYIFKPWQLQKKNSKYFSIAAISGFCFIRCLFWMKCSQYYRSRNVAAVLLETVCSLPSNELKWYIKSGLYVEAESLEYKLNICITVCLSIVHFESIFFSLTPENFKNGKVFEVSKDLGEKNFSFTGK